MSAFDEQIYALVAQIPYGQVATYGLLARMAGKPHGARLAGYAMSRCPDELPWHRVVRADGSIAGGGYAELRRALLAQENVPFLPDGRVDVPRCLWGKEDTSV